MLTVIAGAATLATGALSGPVHDACVALQSGRSEAQCRCADERLSERLDPREQQIAAASLSGDTARLMELLESLPTETRNRTLQQIGMTLREVSAVCEGGGRGRNDGPTGGADPAEDEAGPPCLPSDGAGAADQCMIRMTGAANPAAVMTYTYSGDFTEYRTGDGQRIYMAPDRVAMFDPNRGGWVDIPPAAQGMVASQMTGAGTMPDNMGEAPDFSARMPHALTARFARSEILPEAEADGDRVEAATCPGGGTGCTRVRHPESRVGSLVYDRHGRLVGMNDADADARVAFEYGRWELDAPADW